MKIQRNYKDPSYEEVQINLWFLSGWKYIWIKESTTWSFLYCLWECWECQETEREQWQSLVWWKGVDCMSVGRLVQGLLVGSALKQPFLRLNNTEPELTGLADTVPPSSEASLTAIFAVPDEVCWSAWHCQFETWIEMFMNSCSGQNECSHKIWSFPTVFKSYLPIVRICPKGFKLHLV